MTYSIPKDYNEFTGIRHCNRSDNSGEDFYHKALNGVFAKVIENNDELYLHMDGAKGGYSPSFIDEAIGNLIYDFGLELVKEKLHLVSSQIEQWNYFLGNNTYKNWLERLQKNQEPVKTEEHPAWFRYRDGKLVQQVWVHKQN